MEQNYPLILVFYLDEDLMRQKDIIIPFTQAVNDMINKKNANAMAFFLPTKGEERIECINPIMVKEADMENINKMVEDIKTSFSVGGAENLPENEITLDSKPCECGMNPDGNCKCE